MNPSPEIVEKIKKLLRLAQSPNIHEAEQALARACELAARYQIDVASLDLDEASERLASEHFHVGQRLSLLQNRAINLVVRFFNVEACLMRPDVLFVGTPTDIAIARYVYEYLVRIGRLWIRQWESNEKQARRKVTKNKRDNFVQGFVYGIASQLNKQRDTFLIQDARYALVLADQQTAREAKLKELVPDMNTIERKVARKHLGALMSGYHRGMETRINTPLNRGTETLALTDR